MEISKKQIQQKSWIEKLYSNPKTNKFAQHLVKAFCNTHYVFEENNIEDVVSHKTLEKGYASKLTDKKLSKEHYDELIAFIVEQLKKDDKIMQLMVEYIKADVILEKVLEKYPNYSKKSEYKDIPTKMKSFIALLCRLPKNAIYDGRVEEAWELLTGRKKLFMIPKIKIDTFLMISKMVHEKSAHSSMASMVNNEVLEKLRNAVK